LQTLAIIKLSEIANPACRFRPCKPAVLKPKGPGSVNQKEKEMKELLEKISSYNLFNNLFPGIVFSIIATNITSYTFIQENLVVGVFFYYFVGLVVSRVGSLMIEPLLKKLSFVKFAKYDAYLAAHKKDEKLEVLSEVNNMYRSILSLIFLVMVLKIYQFIEAEFTIPENWTTYILLSILLIIFLFAYRKQTNYIRKRISSSQ
jgi:hypothetical protein